MIDSAVFWVGEPSLHTQPLAEALARWMPVVVVADKMTEHSLASYGQVSSRNSELVVRPEPSRRRELERQFAGARYQIFSGLGTLPGVTSSMERVAELRPDASRWIFTEPYNQNGLKGAARKVKYWRRLREYGDVIDGALVTGDQAFRQFEALGIAASNLIPFSYAVPVWEADRKVIPSDDLLFVGRLDRRKNVMLLLQSLKAVGDGRWLNLVGTGPLEGKLRSYVERNALPVRFLGPFDNRRVRHIMRESRALILPSRFDGWGAVVNEALMTGTQVVVSSACGSHALVRSSLQGRVFRSGSLESLNQSLGDLQMECWSTDKRNRLRAWALNCISPEALADYLRTAITAREDDRAIVIPPWL